MWKCTDTYFTVADPPLYSDFPRETTPKTVRIEEKDSEKFMTPTTPAEPLPPPQRPVKPLNGKQMIRMNEDRDTDMHPYSAPSKRKGAFPMRAKPKGDVKKRCKECGAIVVGKLKNE